MNNYEVFKSFYNYEDALALQQFLRQRGIEAVIAHNKPIADKVFVGDGMEKDIFLKIKSGDFEHANRLIDEQVENNLSAIDPDYYLFSFADEELFEIVQKADEWNNQDVVLAKMILKDRGYDLSEKQVHEMRSTRIKELAEQEEVSKRWKFWAFVSAFVFPIIGVILGLNVLQSRKVLPDGNKIPVYTPKSRTTAETITIVSVIMLLVFIVRVVMYGLRPPDFIR